MDKQAVAAHLSQSVPCLALTPECPLGDMACTHASHMASCTPQPGQQHMHRWRAACIAWLQHARHGPACTAHMSGRQSSPSRLMSTWPASSMHGWNTCSGRMADCLECSAAGSHCMYAQCCWPAWHSTARMQPAVHRTSPVLRHPTAQNINGTRQRAHALTQRNSTRVRQHTRVSHAGIPKPARAFTLQNSTHSCEAAHARRVRRVAVGHTELEQERAACVAALVWGGRGWQGNGLGRGMGYRAA